MCILSEKLKSIPSPFEPILSNIPSPMLRREEFLKDEWTKSTIITNNITHRNPSYETPQKLALNQVNTTGSL